MTSEERACIGKLVCFRRAGSAGAYHAVNRNVIALRRRVVNAENIVRVRINGQHNAAAFGIGAVPVAVYALRHGRSEV